MCEQMKNDEQAKLFENNPTQISNEEIIDDIIGVDVEHSNAKKIITVSEVVQKDLNTVIGNFIDNIISDEEFKYYFEYTKEEKSKIEKFISPDKSISNVQSELVVLRQWNSFTPILPDDKIQNKGGGYFICHLGKGIVVDPGYNFIEHFFKAGFKIDDIDYVFITHAHDDHTGQLEAILSLLFKRNKQYWNNKELDEIEKSKKIHKIDLYLNVGTFVKFSHILNLNSNQSNIRRVFVMNCHQTFKVDDKIELFTMKVQHNEVITKDYSLGFVFKLSSDDGDKYIRFTGDTGWNSSIEEENKKFITSNQIENIDILVLHIGSIEDSETKYDKSKSFVENSECLYENHLGLIGSIAMVTDNNAKINVVSEFGLELDNIRIKFTELVKKELGLNNILAGDVNMRIDVSGLNIRCSYSKDYFPPEEISAHRKQDGSLIYLNKQETDKLAFRINSQTIIDNINVF